MSPCPFGFTVQSAQLGYKAKSVTLNDAEREEVEAFLERWIPMMMCKMYMWDWRDKP
jgi:hypothetical protein